MKNSIVSGSALAAAAIALALSGVAATPAQASHRHACTMAKGACGGRAGCMTKRGVCKHRMGAHKGNCHTRNHCRTR